MGNISHVHNGTRSLIYNHLGLMLDGGTCVEGLPDQKERKPVVEE